MTNYSSWDRKADQLCKEAEEEDEQLKKENDEALGLQDGPVGPPIAKAKKQREEMGEHSDDRKKFIEGQEKKEFTYEHPDGSDERIVIKEEDAKDKAVRIRNSKNVTYEFPTGLVVLKIYIDKCTNVKLNLAATLKTSFLECNHSSDIEVRAEKALSTVQVDECQGPIRIIYQEPEDIGTFFHQNCPKLEVTVPGHEPIVIGRKGGEQMVTKVSATGATHTEEVLRGEKDFPIQLGTSRNQDSEERIKEDALNEQTSEAQREKAEAKRAEGNEAFKASDYLQAAVFYTQAIQLCGDLHLAFANRAACFLKTAEPERALKDATRCTELHLDYSKGWFRKGMALHALERYAAAIPALLEAEKLEPKNTQIPDAIKMAQLMARSKGPGEM